MSINILRYNVQLHCFTQLRNGLIKLKHVPDVDLNKYMVCQKVNYCCLCTCVDMQTQWKKHIIKPIFINQATIRHYKKPEPLASAIKYILKLINNKYIYSFPQCIQGYIRRAG
jgi:hypothetical protein